MNLSITKLGGDVLPFIDGEWCASKSDGHTEVLNPSTGKRILDLPKGSVLDADAAVSAARSSFEDGRWSESSPSSRKKVLYRFAGLIEASSNELDSLDAEEMGKPVAEVFSNAAAAAELVRFYAEAVDKVSGAVFTSDKGSFVARRVIPRGVVAAIVPWNFPSFCAVLKVAPALAAGNSVVLKPSELSSRSALRLGQLALEAGLPRGVLNVVPGLGETVGQALGLHLDVDMVTFTGSTSVGKRMLQYAGQSNMKVVMTECGGKSPQIVFADGVDLNAAADSIAQHLLTNQGQICSVGSRLLVQRSIERAMIDKISARLGNAVMGDALDPKTTFGPLASAEQYARVMRYIKAAEDEGVQLVTGGRRALPETGGYFVEPTIFQNVSPQARIAQDEIFGPVLSVIPFDSEGDAIRIANDTIYGLAAYVWTANLSTGMRMAKGVRSTVFVNAVAPKNEGAGYATTYEPTAQSGIGAEGGLAGMESYLRRQLVWFSHG
ncbi:aldehyde dehydrogenase [Steroidobacter agaridevorans]|uniref:Aldehyde dehydrogenase n=1 Tax=Steroidobacter agaridevorans TaxID=2695856 RepID=A0A829YKD8_9GAMM|nr:aldehyde dehydrogenase family protein [Steroidobacter agaridevorans]GFE83710.1 aldehyde dehydrogenase [Steroidobacter agaridevorans]